MREKDLNHLVTKTFKLLYPRSSFICRVENNVALGGTEGMPDLYFCVSGILGWIECKYKEKIPTRTPVFATKGLRQAQISWLNDYYAAEGRRAWILAQVENTIYLVDGKKANYFNGWDITELAAYCRVFVALNDIDVLIYRAVKDSQ